MRQLLLVLFLAFLSGCLASEGSDNPATDIPTVEVECYSGQASDCTTDNSQLSFYIGFSPDLDLDCQSYLFTIGSTSDFTLGFQLSGSGLSFAYQTGLSGDMGAWSDASGNPRTTVASGDYIVCAYLDRNSNGQPDSTEPMASQTVVLPSSYILIDQWSEL